MTESFDYPRMLQRALRSLVREVLTVTAAEGLPGEHHFYLSLRTDHPEARIPAFLRDRYPEEMTVVLQDQFWELTAGEEGFGVTLRFDGVPARIEVPYDAVVAFFDPAAQFGLRFDLAGLGSVAPAAPGEVEAVGAPPVEGGDRSGAPGEDAADDPARRPNGGEGKVLSFDRTRERRDPESE